MNRDSRDLTIEGALADPMIRAVMKADRVEPRAFEMLLRNAAREVATVTPRAPVGFLGRRSCGGFARACFA